MRIIKRKSWQLREYEATDEHLFLNRRKILKTMGLAGAGAFLGSQGGVASALAATNGESGLYPAKRNGKYAIQREITPESVSSVYNNFYEFGSHKGIYGAAQALKTDPWSVEFDGLVEKPFTIGLEDLLKKVDLEERLYRHRCVEAWAMTVPWTGFPLSELVKMAQPTSDAKYVKFETFMNPDEASGQKQFWYPWPYKEGLTMDEAMNELGFVVTGIYGKPLLKQYGAPIRIVLPWKYGFKSIKSIVKMTFTSEKPLSFWEKIAPDEYGFWANVNPEVPHPRWSQATEQLLGSGDRVPTRLYNGYEEQVAHLYKNIEGQQLYR